MVSAEPLQALTVTIDLKSNMARRCPSVFSAARSVESPADEMAHPPQDILVKPWTGKRLHRLTSRRGGPTVSIQAFSRACIAQGLHGARRYVPKQPNEGTGDTQIANEAPRPTYHHKGF